MRALVVGLGSMGRRRARLLKEYFSAELRGVDGRADRREQAQRELGLECRADLDEALEDFSTDCALICTSPLSHAGLIRELLERGLHVFTEINLTSEGYAENTALARKKKLTLFLSSTQLYRGELKWIAKRAEAEKGPLVYRYHVGQYLPDWHPWESIKDYFVGDRRTNGCREIMAIEFPWLERAFGKIRGFKSEARRLTSLPLDFPDCFFISLEHEGGAEGRLMIDLACRRASRRLEIVGEDIYTSWGGTPDTLFDFDTNTGEYKQIETGEEALRDKRYAENIVENAYIDELAAFIKTLGGEEALRHSFEDDERLLGIIDRIEGEALIK
ncbi:MAG: Gfo/Idh/MocA family oxidoreductase [Oscillospiraceae bacterium]|nr:Gfo/Idh/MocA family oxidoreductase [Oscillospiraceae bacterium]